MPCARCIDISHYTLLLSTHVTRCSIFKYGSIILSRLRASIGVTRSYSSRPFICALVYTQCTFMKRVWTPHLTMEVQQCGVSNTMIHLEYVMDNWFLHETVTYMYMDILMHDYALTCLVVPQMPWCWGQWGCLSLGTAAPSLRCSACGWEDGYTIQESHCELICSAQSDNLCNLKTALHILRILRLSRQSGDCITRVQSRDCAEHIYTIKDMLNSERTQ